MNLEVLRYGPEPTADGRPPLLFIHGSFCGAWIWQEHFLPYFAEAGWPCLAVSLRGHGGSDGIESLDQWGLADYVNDVAAAAAGLPRPPVVIGHSLGGMVAQRFVCRHVAAGLVLLCSVGPGGLSGSVTHMAFRHADVLWQLNTMQSIGPEAVEYETVRRGLFSRDFPPEKAWAYVPRFQRESLRIPMEMMIPQWYALSAHPSIPCLVMGGDHDAFIPRSDLTSAARFWRADLEILNGVPHVVMLDTSWQRAAEGVRRWLDKTYLASPERAAS